MCYKSVNNGNKCVYYLLCRGKQDATPIDKTLLSMFDHHCFTKRVSFFKSQ